ncbi:MAG: nickel pincer cofactor biosynthesis protein LarB [Myxococcales bacterium]|nr:nickel pincer cofactor biosynthesis protein LarB [Myxococcales bacterium]
MSRISEIEGLARLDVDRASRAGVPEAVLAEGKSLEVVVRCAEALARANGRVLVTRLQAGQGDELAVALRAAEAPLETELFGGGRTAVVRQPGSEAPAVVATIGVLAAGTSDVPLAEEARVTAREMGVDALTFYDVGVAGIHRLQQPLERILAADLPVLVVAAGMEGALATVVKGLVPVPVIGVPSAVGYGYGRGGEAALMAMLQSCSPGVLVVNIDNGFGAGAAAAMIARRARASQSASHGGESA